MTFQSHDPATDELIGTYPEHDAAETNVRLQRAWDGWLRWSRTPLPERTAFLIRLADLLDARAETYARLITAEMGKPLPDAIAESKKSALDARHKAEAGEAYLRPQPIPGASAQITYESIGPIFSVQPWNLPSHRDDGGVADKSGGSEEAQRSGKGVRDQRSHPSQARCRRTFVSASSCSG